MQGGLVKAPRGKRAVILSRRSSSSESEQPVPQADRRALPRPPFPLFKDCRETIAVVLPPPFPLFKGTCDATAVETAATAAGSKTSNVQRWQGSNDAAARVAACSMQLWPTPGCADRTDRANVSSDHDGVGVVQLGRGGGNKLGRKRLAEVTTAEPAGKRRQADHDALGSTGQQNLFCLTANRLLGDGIGSRKDSEGGFGLSSTPAGLGVNSPAAVRFRWFLKKMNHLESQLKLHL